MTAGGFDVGFELEVLSGAASDSTYRRKIRRVVTGVEPWSTDAHRFLWGLIDRLGEGDTLHAGIVLSSTTPLDDDEAEEVIASAKAVLKKSAKAKHYAAKKLDEWVRAARMKSSMGSAIRLLGDGEVDKAEEALRLGAKSSSLVAYEAGDWFESFDERMAERERIRKEPDLRPYVPFRIPSVDKALNGGLRVTQFGLVVGHTGRGKSTIANHIAFYSAAASNRTIYISTEMNKALIDTRFDAKMFGKTCADFTAGKFSTSELAAMADKRARLARRMATMLRTVSVPVRTLTKEMIEEIIDEYEQDHGEPLRTLVLDSPDHMRPKVTIRDERHQQASHYWDVKQVTEERRVASIATTQAPKEYVNKLITAEGTSESYDKARICDWIGTINQTPAEKKAGIMRFFTAKNRTGEMGGIAYLATDFARMHLEETAPPASAGDGDDEGGEE